MIKLEEKERKYYRFGFNAIFHVLKKEETLGDFVLNVDYGNLSIVKSKFNVDGLSIEEVEEYLEDQFCEEPEPDYNCKNYFETD